MEGENKLIVFENKKIRRTWYEGDWWFSVVDMVGVLDASGRPRKYWADLKKKLAEEGFEVSDIIGQLKLEAPDGKLRETDCANKEGILRVIQSIPSKRAEPFKRWLAKVGSERINEIENPELAQERMKVLYEEKGYSKSWIEKRLRGIAIRQDLTDEWKSRGVDKNMEFAILTNEISKATFGKTIEEYKQFKSLRRENLRDHMNDIELVLTMLGEATTTEFTKERNSQIFPKLRQDAKDGGDVAGTTKRDIEKRLGKPIVSKENFLEQPEKRRRLTEE